jgi:hypothetical protein
MDGNLEDDESSREERYRKKWEAVFIYCSTAEDFSVLLLFY